ncbi:MAG TPA: homoserine kinase [Vicinamibacterales bacterium]|nr:homoserine kinase [Vicinamibacterales bacterium]
MTDRGHQTVTAFAPATVANVACGFDVLGFALSAPGDEIVATRRRAPGVVIDGITGDGGRLPRDAARNTAGVAAQALLDAARSGDGVSIVLHKGLPLSSGLGGSAASAVAAVVAVDALLGLGASTDLLLQCALAGERLASGSTHPDNVAPALLGGFVLARSAVPPDLVRLPVPDGLACAIVHPHLEVETAAARRLLGDTVPLQAAIRQWANLGGLVAGLFRSDFALIGRSLEDVVAEPKRSALVPGFAAMKQAALDAGALGCSLSGSGPSLFALCRTADEAARVAGAMREALERAEGIASDTWVSPVGQEGARVMRTSDTACAS